MTGGRDGGGPARRDRSLLVCAAWSAVLAAVLLWPQHASGYGLGRDLVFTPGQPLTAATFGASSAAPRAVPVDALVALVEKLVDGAVVGRVALLVPLLAAGIGVAALLRTDGARGVVIGRLAATTFAIWNPFVVERLALGQWALLWAYGAVPWVVRSAAAVRGDVLRGDTVHGDTVRGPATRGGAWRVVLPVAAASLTATGGLVATAVAVTITGLRTRRARLAAVLCMLLQAPWLVGAAVSTARTSGDSAGTLAFATRGDVLGGAGGAVLAALSGGGVWNAAAVPPSRDGVLGVLVLAVLGAAAAYGWPGVRRALGSAVLRRWAALAAVATALALAGSIPGLRDVVTSVSAHVPGGGLLRDGQKWLLPLVVLEALLAGAAAGRLVAALARTWRPAVLVLGISVPVLLLPDAAATVRPSMTPVHYPSGWQRVRDATARGDVTVLPFQAYRALPWTGARPVLDPAPRLLGGTVVTDDTLVVHDRRVPGTDSRAARVGAALRSGPELVAGLRAAGIRWVLVERGTPGAVPDLRALQPAYRDADLALYRVPGAVRSVRPATARIAAGVAALAVWAMLVLVACLAAIRQPLRRLTRGSAPELLQSPDTTRGGS